MPGGPGISNIPGCALQHKLLLPVFMQWPVKASFQKPRLATHCLSTTCSLDLGANLHGPFTLASFMIEKKQYPVDSLDNFNWQLAMSPEPCGTAARGPVCFSGICLSKCFPPRGGSLQQHSQSSSRTFQWIRIFTSWMFQGWEALPSKNLSHCFNQSKMFLFKGVNL